MYYSAGWLFDGVNGQPPLAIETEDGRVKRLLHPEEVPSGAPHRSFANCILVPAFVDAQVYGAAGRLFSAYPDTESLRALAAHAWEGGAALVQPTVATNSPEVLRACIEAVRQYWKEGGEGVGGLHLEGPWISAERKGAHAIEYIHPPTVDEVKALLEVGRGIVRTITLAPEVCSREVIRLLQDAGIVLSAGHSNCSTAEALAAFEGGINAVTHLYNAMSPLQHRAPGLVGACFLDGKVRASIIPDGFHVDFDAVCIAWNAMRSRLFAITDAVTETGDGPYRHHYNEEGYYSSNGILSGSALTMDGAFQNLFRKVGMDEAAALEMCTSIPARVFGWEHFGHIVPGAAACFLIYDKDWNLVERISEPGSRLPALTCGVSPTAKTS